MGSGQERLMKMHWNLPELRYSTRRVLDFNDTENINIWGNLETLRGNVLKKIVRKKPLITGTFLPHEKRPRNLPTHPQTANGRFSWQLEYGRDPLGATSILKLPRETSIWRLWVCGFPTVTFRLWQFGTNSLFCSNGHLCISRSL